MEDSSSNPFHNRSISLPTKSNPILARLQECLRVVNEWQTKPHSLSSNGLGLLKDLYRSTGDCMRMDQTQQALRGQESFVSKLVDDFLRLLDVCGTVKDSLLQTREHQQSLQSMFRRKDQNLSSGISSSTDYKADEMLRDVRVSTISVLEILASVVSAHNSSKSIFSRLRSLSSKKDAEESGNEIELLDQVLFVILGHSCKVDQDSVESVQRLMGSLDDCLREVEDELESVSRCLINARVTLLNILTCR